MRARLHKNGWTILSYVILTAAVLLAGGPLVIVIFASFRDSLRLSATRRPFCRNGFRCIGLRICFIRRTF